MDQALRESLERQADQVIEHESLAHDALIMMVDDEPILHEVFKGMLEERGYRRFVTCDESGAALELIERHRPDVLLLDLVMPGVNGFDILLELRSRMETRHLSVIVLTSSSDAETKLKALELGATDFLAKPVDPSELSLRLRNTLAAKAYQDRLANLDQLTGLTNRKRFQELLEGVMRRVSRSGEEAWLLMLGLQNFKSINDALGPSVGDEILRQLASRLELVLEEHASSGPGQLARVGGDEFAVLLRGWHQDSVVALARDAVAEVDAPFQVGEEGIYAKCSLGVGAASAAESGEMLIQQASVAQKHAKRSVHSSLAFYSPEIDAEAKGLLRLENDMRSAIDLEEFELHFQPKLSTASRRVVGVEALVRWNRNGTMESPARFIPLAEASGLILPLGEWVLREACRRGKALERSGLDLKVSVNVSARQIMSPGLVRCVADALAENDLAADKLIVEITESAIMEDLEACLQVLEEIRALGVMLSIDDFGTGQSSLSYLTRMPVGELKIDQSFLRGVPEQASDVAIIKAIIALAGGLDMIVTAEGTETAEQVDFLAAHGCDQLQGFLFSRPLPFDQLHAFCEERR